MIKFSKLTGNGNDFIVFNNMDGSLDQYINAEFVIKISKRALSVGADGVFFLCKSDKVDFAWRFFNSDGSEAEMCGNGSRCVAKFAYKNNIAKTSMKFETGAGIIEATIINDLDVKVQLTTPHGLQLDNMIEIDGVKYNYSFLNTGVPHVVIFLDDIENVDVKALGSKIRYHESFAPKGTNVNFIKVVSGSELNIRTYERGVEDETLACGTGATAATLISIEKGFTTSPTVLKTADNGYLTVSKEGDKVYLQGATRHIYDGELNAESYKY